MGSLVGIARIRCQMSVLQIVRRSLPTIAAALMVCGPSLAAGPATLVPGEQQYVEALQEKLQKVYFPPQGAWNYAGSTIKITIESDGTAKLTEIVQPPLVKGRRSTVAEQCLRSAVENLNPLQPPPSDMKLPAKFLVKFVVQAKGAFLLKCLAKRL